MSASDLPKALRNAAANGNLVPFVGAGVSLGVKSSGVSLFPSGGQLLHRAADRLAEEGCSEHQIVREILEEDAPDLMQAARFAKEGLGPLWPAFLSDIFGVERAIIDEPTLDLAKAVWGIGSKLVITTNYDRVLRWACPRVDDMDEWQIEAAHGLIQAQRGSLTRHTVWHLHGSVNDAAKIILSPDGYDLLYSEDQQVTLYQAALSSLRQLMSIRHFLFIGFSLQDDYSVNQLKWVARSFSGCAGPHYVLTREVEREAVLKRVIGLDVHIVPFRDFGAPMLATLEEIGAQSAAREERKGNAVESTIHQSKAIIDNLDAQLELYQNTRREKSKLEIGLGSGNWTNAFAEMVFAWGFAHAGHREKAEELVEHAKELLGDQMEPLHRVVFDSYRVRIEHQSRGQHPKAPLFIGSVPTEIHDAWSVAMSTLGDVGAYKFFRLLETSLILRGSVNLNAFELWDRKGDPSYVPHSPPSHGKRAGLPDDVEGLFRVNRGFGDGRGGRLPSVQQYKMMNAVVDSLNDDVWHDSELVRQRLVKCLEFRLPTVSDSFSTCSHFCLAVIHHVELVVNLTV